ncbi:MAG: peptidoglycan DD-metalloendopeptidase family protein [Synergistetes bacterium]|nr:peptidoglycan DD-metalloendopeptidase family protein [Synergistota bacterium]
MVKNRWKEFLQKKWNILIVPYTSGKPISFPISGFLIFCTILSLSVGMSLWTYVFFRNIRIIKQQSVEIAMDRSLINGLVSGMMKKDKIKDDIVGRLRVRRMELVYDLDEVSRQQDETIALLRLRIKKLKENVVALKNRNETLVRLNNTNLKKMGDLWRLSAIQGKKISSLQSKIATLEGEITSLKSDNTRLAKTNTNYLLQINRLSEMNKDADENLGSLMAQLDTLESKLADVQSLYEEISNMNRKHVTVITELKQSNLQKDRELEILREKITYLEKKMGSINKLAKKVCEINAIMHSGGGIEAEAPEGIYKNKDELSLHKRISYAIREASSIESRLKRLYKILVQKRDRWLSTPNVWPTFGSITSPYGMRKDPITGRREMHWGIDIANKYGTPIYSTVQGVVSFAGWKWGLGRCIIITTRTGYKIYFGHLSHILVRRGQKVYKGQLIGNMGSTGRSTGVHLHYEIHYRGKPVNPLKFLKHK